MKTLREWRDERVFGQADLAKHAGVRQATIAEIETGKRVPRRETMRKISAALGVDVREVAEFAAALELPPRVPERTNRRQDES